MPNPTISLSKMLKAAETLEDCLVCSDCLAADSCSADQFARMSEHKDVLHNEMYMDMLCITDWWHGLYACLISHDRMLCS